MTGSNHCQENFITWGQLIERLLKIFEKDEVNPNEVELLLSAYQSNWNDWEKFAKYDMYKYTRNLVHEGNGKFNLMLLCWSPGNQSTIHDHADAHCFVKVLSGQLTEVRMYVWQQKIVLKVLWHHQTFHLLVFVNIKRGCH